MPENVSRERKRIIRAFGAQVVFSSGLEGSDGAILLCRELLHEAPERYFKPDQYFNPMQPAGPLREHRDRRSGRRPRAA